MHNGADWERSQGKQAGIQTNKQTKLCFAHLWPPINAAPHPEDGLQSRGRGGYSARCPRWRRVSCCEQRSAETGVFSSRLATITFDRQEIVLHSTLLFKTHPLLPPPYPPSPGTARNGRSSEYFWWDAMDMTSPDVCLCTNVYFVFLGILLCTSPATMCRPLESTSVT